MKLLLKLKAKFHLSYIHSGHCMVFCNRRKLAHHAPPIFLSFKRKGNNRVQERGLQHILKFWHNFILWGESHKASGNACAHTWQNFSFTLKYLCRADFRVQECTGVVKEWSLLRGLKNLKKHYRLSTEL